MGQSSVMMMHITLVRFLRTQGFDHLKALPPPHPASLNSSNTIKQ